MLRVKDTETKSLVFQLIKTALGSLLLQEPVVDSGLKVNNPSSNPGGDQFLSRGYIVHR